MSADASVISMSSSPEFPSIHDLEPRYLASQQAQPGGSNAARIPGSSVTGFRSAADIWKPTLEKRSVVEKDDILRPFSGDRAVTGESKAREDKSVTDGESKTNETRKSDSRRLETVDSEPRQFGILKARETAGLTTKPSSRGKYADTLKAVTAMGGSVTGKNTVLQGKVTKASTQPRVPRKKPETVSQFFATDSPTAVAKENMVPRMEEPLDLEPAMMRRTDWTPTKDTISVLSYSPSILKMSSSINQSQGVARLASKQGFERLSDDYGRNAEEVVAKGVDQPERAVHIETSADILGKRKLLEMVTTSSRKSSAVSVSPTKTKAFKKKPRTITGLATAAYKAEEQNAAALTSALPTSSLLSYFTVAPSPPHVEKSTTKTLEAKVKAHRKKKAGQQKRILLSPTSALREVSDQDFVFGTASQLAIEEDPTLLRALHEAMQKSNEEVNTLRDSSPPQAASSALGRQGKQLWAAGARGLGGDLMKSEVIDLTDSPVAPQKTAHAPNPSYKQGTTPFTSTEPLVIDSPEFEFDGSESPPLPASASLPSAQPSDNRSFGTSLSQANLARDSPPVSSPWPNLDFDHGPPASNQQQHQQMEGKSPLAASPRAVKIPRHPNYELYTDARLAREVRGYGFKAVKRRTNMIALLEKCWASKNEVTLPHAGRAVLSTSPAAKAPKGRPKMAPEKVTKPASVMESGSPVKRPRGRPKKDATVAASKPHTSKGQETVTNAAAVLAESTCTKATTSIRRKAPSKSWKKPIDEIPASASESEKPFLSSAEDLSGDEDDAPASKAALSSGANYTVGEADMSLALDPSEQEAELFSCITQAVTTAPPCKDPLQPSWHEKILMYDPIVVEDLAAWLNSGQLDRVGYDGEVAGSMVKKWCESKSICCAFKLGFSGRERKRLMG